MHRPCCSILADHYSYTNHRHSRGGGLYVRSTEHAAALRKLLLLAYIRASVACASTATVAEHSRRTVTLLSVLQGNTGRALVLSQQILSVVNVRVD